MFASLFRDNRRGACADDDGGEPRRIRKQTPPSRIGSGSCVEEMGLEIIPELPEEAASYLWDVDVVVVEI